MKKVLYSLLGLLLLGANLVAQETKHWTIGLTVEHGRLSHEYDELGKGDVLIPSIRYNFNNNWSVGLNALLPLSTTKDTSVRSFSKIVRGLHYTTGGELSVTKSIEPIRKLKISLSAVALLGIIGNYKKLEYQFVYGGNGLYGQHNSNTDTYSVVRHKHWRWAVGLRPKVSYQFSPTWGVELSYGFWGYRSQNEMIQDSYYLEEKDSTSGAWGFNDELGWGNGWRLGITYSF